MLRTEHIHLLAPPSGRRDTLVAALELLHETNVPGQEVRIVEVGTSRDLRPSACLADGWATRVFAWYAAQVDGRVISIDPEPHANACALRIVGEFAPWLIQQQLLAQDFLAGFRARIDLAYMDGPHRDDTTDPGGVHLAMYRAAFGACPEGPPRFVLFDDADAKGGDAIPAMQEDGYTLLWTRDNQALLQWPR